MTPSDQPKRVLGRIRLSKETGEEGTSIERQREAILQWSAMHGHTVIGWAEDIGVSGSADPFDTPELGKWLRQDALPQWDTVCAYRLDRFSRRVIPINKLFGFLLEHDKTLSTVSESIDLSNWVGRLVANVIAGVAEGELEAISERNRGSQTAVRQAGRWHGGRPGYGTLAEKRADGWYLVEHPEEAKVLREKIVPRVLAHESITSIARQLNIEGVPLRSGTEWTPSTLGVILRSRRLLGEQTHHGKTIVGEDGLPLISGPQLVTRDEFERIQSALGAKAIRASKSETLLSGVVFCDLCGSPLYHQGANVYRYYRCANARHGCRAKALRVETLCELVEQHFLDDIGDCERRERVYVPGSNHAETLAVVNSAIESVRQEKDLGLYDGDEASYLDRLKKLTVRKRELESETATPGGFQWVGTGETYREAWERMTVPERRTLLHKSKIRVEAGSPGGKALRVAMHLPEDLRAELER